MPSVRPFDALAAFHPLSEISRFALEREWVGLSLPKHHMLLEAPRIADQAYYLQSGFAMGFQYVDSEKFVQNFWKPGQIITAPVSFLEQSPSMEFIQLMDNCELLCLSHAGFERLMSDHDDIRQLFYKVIGRNFRFAKEAKLENHLLSATGRHRNLLASYPGIEQIVPQENIASWLDITAQSLSRIKRRH